MRRTKRYMLDTNTVSHLIKQHPVVVSHVITTPMPLLCISTITEGELLFGLAKRPLAKGLQAAVLEFLRRADVLAWNSEAAQSYGAMRAELESKGKTLGSLDALIGAHALASSSVLVTNDRAFAQVASLELQDWTI